MSKFPKNNKDIKLKMINKIVKKKEEYFPSKLFKYRAINKNNISNLENDILCLSYPYQFNDPYDSFCNTDMNEIYLKIKEKLKEEIIKNELEKNGIYIPLNKIKGMEQMINEINIIGFEKIKDLLYKDDEIIKCLNKLDQKFKVCCFSCINNSILMWSHYANNHEGFCIEYNIKEIESKIKNKIYPVFYQTKLLPSFKISKYSPLLKFYDWNYEYEWRYITHDENEISIPIKPSAIYLGTNFNGNIEEFKKIANDKNCNLYKMYLNNSNYQLKSKKIN